MVPTRHSLLFTSLCSLTLGAAGLHPSPLQAQQPATTFVQQWCIDCHDADNAKGGLDLNAIRHGQDADAHAKWVRVHDAILSGKMPPANKEQPDAQSKKAFLASLGQLLTAQHNKEKGTILRRLNRIEYENTLRDLLGMRVEVREMLPEDSLSHGFDNIGEALSMSDVQLARYMEAAEFALNSALQVSQQPKTVKESHDFLARANKGSHWRVLEDNAVVFFNNGIEPDTSLRSFRALAEGMYRFTISGYAFQSPEPVSFSVHSGPHGKIPTELVSYYELSSDKSQTLTIETWLRIGETIKISPNLRLNLDEFKKSGGKNAFPGKGLAIKNVAVEGPIYAQWPPRGVELLFGELAKSATETPLVVSKDGVVSPRPIIDVSSTAPQADAARQLRTFATAAFRRPVDDGKLAPYLALFQSETQKGSQFSTAMRTAAIAILCAPDFLYLREPSGRLDDYALAARLSYFLWRTAPDAELLSLAATGKLRNPATLRQQTTRLLSHPNASRFITDFTDGWLNLREINATSPDRKLYPEYDGQLQDALLAESRAFFDELLQSNLPVMNIVTSDFAMLNGRLAEHYAIPNVEGVQFRKVALTPENKRGGVLTQGAVHKVTANGTATSPVTRGVWVLDRILGTPPQPPPPGTPGLEPDVRGAKSLREQLQMHRDLVSCNSCHKSIDPPGFALESYDVIGGYRVKFRSTRRQKGKMDLLNGPLVDCTGELEDGTKFASFAEFQQLLLKQQEQITRNMTDRLLTFGSGREMGFSDREEITRIVTELAARKGGMQDLLHLVIGSRIFQSE